MAKKRRCLDNETLKNFGMKKVKDENGVWVWELKKSKKEVK